MENKMNRINEILERKTLEAEELKAHIGKTVRIHGSIYKIRKMSDFAFVLLRTKRTVVQCVYAKEFSHFELDELIEESCVIVTAEVVQEERAKVGYELRMIEADILSELFPRDINRLMP